jgi:hypothetical protein
VATVHKWKGQFLKFFSAGKIEYPRTIIMKLDLYIKSSTQN